MPRNKWRDLELIDDRLWYGPIHRIMQRPRARFDADALVIVDRTGSERRYKWVDHAKGSSSLPTAERWELYGLPPSRTSFAAVYLGIGDEFRGYSYSRRLAGLRWPNMAGWEEVPALAAYISVTPAAQVGVTHSGCVQNLLCDLAAKSWRRPRKPNEPPYGDRLDAHLAVSAVLNRRMRRFGDRFVRGETVPPVGDLVDQSMNQLPSWVRPRVTEEDIRRRVERHLATGRWPFNALIGP